MIRTEYDHQEGCLREGMGPNEIHTQREEDAKAQRAENRLEEQRLEDFEQP
jgi:hypothetical protein